MYSPEKNQTAAHRLQSEAGSAMLEFAVVALTVFVLCFGSKNINRVVGTQAALCNLVEDAQLEFAETDIGITSGANVFRENVARAHEITENRYRQEIDGRQVAPSEAAIDLPPADAWFVEWFNR